MDSKGCIFENQPKKKKSKKKDGSTEYNTSGIPTGTVILPGMLSYNSLGFVPDEEKRKDPNR